MKVSELIERLSECDPDAEVVLVTQQNWPFENAIEGLTTREDAARSDEDRDEDGDDDHDESGDTRRNDVFLVEGEQLRYGTKNAWNVCH